MINDKVFNKALSLTLLLIGVLLTSNSQANSLERLFAPKAELWSYWQQHDKTSTKQINHSLWDSFLQTYVVQSEDGIHRLRYADVSQNDRLALQNYISYLEQLPVRSFNQQEQLVYWINLYNALTVQVILQHYPVASIRDIDISPGFFSDGPWDKKLLTIESQAISLNDIEHRILRPIWRDPGVHYALNCASLGCPNLQHNAFSVNTIEGMLEQAAYDYINHPRGARVDEGKLTVSSIYNWFQDDFGDSETAVINHIKIYADRELTRALQLVKSIDGYEYDWSLNDAMPKAKTHDDGSAF
ncbi:MAG: DUF547 domain-containing protein [Gammaproteobacteria bacterium]|jgi:hypothetical protein|nr:DUF547 domain-containing protein [Gammaproteobacteria bacterium]